MKMNSAMLKALAVLLIGVTGAICCTRIVYLGPDGRILTGRSMDWKVDVVTNLWILPREVERTGLAGPNSIRWVSKYGSVVATGYEVTSADGLNEAGLAANLLWLVESEYPKLGGNIPALSMSLWAQYMLDNFATVKEAVDAANRGAFAVVTSQVPGEERLATMHLSLSDKSGDSAIMEYIGGKLHVHHGREYQVMTNSPTYDEQLALVKYWTEVGGTVMLPGTNRAADRFARANFYVKAIPQVEDQLTATAGVFSVMRNVSVPWGITTPDQPNISSTRWRTVADHKSLLYYFESAVTPNIFWVDLKRIDFSPGSGARTLRLGPNQSSVFSGEVSGQFEAATPFTFASVD